MQRGPRVGPAGLGGGGSLGELLFTISAYAFGTLAALGILIKIWDNFSRRQIGWGIFWIGVGVAYCWLVYALLSSSV